MQNSSALKLVEVIIGIKNFIIIYLCIIIIVIIHYFCCYYIGTLSTWKASSKIKFKKIVKKISLCLQWNKNKNITFFNLLMLSPIVFVDK